MNIQEKINFFTKNMNLKFALARMGQIIVLKDEIGRYLKKEIESRSKILQFTSQDLRSLTVQLEKVHKLANKKISFVEIEKRLIQRIEKIRDEILSEKDEKKKDKLRRIPYTEETNQVSQYMALARDLQMLVSCFNYYSTDVRLLEKIAEQEKQADDKILQEELEFILFDLMNGN